MNSTPIPSVPWQVTGNHWLALPCIHPADGAIHAVGVLHRGARAAIEFAGGPRFAEGDAPPLLRPVLTIDGSPVDLARQAMAWERGLAWVPTFTTAAEDLVVRGTVFAPYGRDADTAGAVYALTVENRGTTRRDVTVALTGTLGHRQQRVRSARAFSDAHIVTPVAGGTLVLEGAAIPALASLALTSDGEVAVEVSSDAAPRYSLARSVVVEPGAVADVAFYLAAGPERDGAEATVAVLRRRGWRELLAATRDALRAFEQTTGSEAADRVVNRNLLFAYFFAVGRALDDAHYYFVRTRIPWHSAGVTAREWEALMWTLPAIQLADTPLARELVLRACELHGYAPGAGTRYFDGTLFEPGFSLDGCAAYAVAVDRYIRDSGDDEIVEEPVLADTLYLSSDDIAARRHQDVPLYSTELNPRGHPVPLPYTLHANAVTALALDALRRTLDEETANQLENPEAVRAAVHRHLTRDRDGRRTFLAATDLAGATATDDDPYASLLWLPLYELTDRDDSTYRRSTRAVGSGAELIRQIARLLGPDGGTALSWLRRAALDNGLAAEIVDGDGRAIANGGDAALAGLLAYTVWYAAHALGVRP